LTLISARLQSLLPYAHKDPEDLESAFSQNVLKNRPKAALHVYPFN